MYKGYIMELMSKIESYLDKFLSFFIEYSLFEKEQQKEFNEIVEDVLKNEI